MTTVIPTVTYAWDTWMMTASITNMLDVFYRQCLRNIMRISWFDHITNKEVMRRARVALLSDMVADRRRRLATCTPMARECPASVARDWVPDGGRRKRGRPKNTWRHLKNISKIQYWFDPHQCCFSYIYLTGSHWSSTVARLLHCYGKVMHFLSIPWGFDVEDDLVGVWYKNM